MGHVDIDTVVAELKERIADRQRAGDYPEGMEQQLESEFAAMMRAVDRSEIDTEHLNHLVTVAGDAVNRVAADAGVTSRVPGGSQAHAAAARLVRRHTGPLAESVRALGNTVVEALEESRRLFDAQRSADERQLLDALAGVLDRLAVLDHVVEITRDLDERVARLESALEAANTT